MITRDDIFTVVHLLAWAEIGTVARIYIGKLFGGSCNPGYDGRWQWIPCVTSPGLVRLGGAFFQDLPANVIGSFAMGLFSSSATLAAAYSHNGAGKAGTVALAILPASSSLQKHVPLHLGLRTGFCGCFTTFASWMLQMVEMMVGGKPSMLGPEWVAALWGLYTNVAMSLTALVSGQYIALMLHCRVYKNESAEEDKPQQPATNPDSAALTHDTTAPQLSIEITAAHTHCVQRGHVVGTQINPSDQQQPVQSTAPGHNLNMSSSSSAIPDPLIASPHDTLPAPASPPPVSSPPPGNAKAVSQTSSHPTALCWAVDLVALIVYIFLTAISITYAAIDGGNLTREQDEQGIWYIWISILLAPAGCIIRWRLSFLNGKMGWFPLGTFLANTSASLLDFIIQVLLVRLSLTYLQIAVLQAIQVGVNGSLSTVSTWVVEVS
ncbi:hypothetical protein CEUSTIGMA_g2381.t1, partial [Chlamydomonas eustigma]